MSGNGAGQLADLLKCPETAAQYTQLLDSGVRFNVAYHKLSNILSKLSDNIFITFKSHIKTCIEDICHAVQGVKLPAICPVVQ